MRFRSQWCELRRNSEAESIPVDVRNHGLRYEVRDEVEIEGATELIPNLSWEEKVNPPDDGGDGNAGWDKAMHLVDGGEDGEHRFHQLCAHDLIHQPISYAKPDRLAFSLSWDLLNRAILVHVKCRGSFFLPRLSQEEGVFPLW